MSQRIDTLGLVRFFLASSVILGHLWQAPGFDCHRHAVIGFFCISGYLITRIRSTVYAERTGAFLLNRFLRIYPQYLIAVLLGAAAVLLLPEAAKTMNPALQWPATATDWVRQLFIVGLYEHPVRLSPPTWSLNVELYFYAVVGLLTFRSEKATYAAFLLTLAVGLLALFQVWTNPVFRIVPTQFYGSPTGNAFVFFMGSATHFVARRIRLPGWVPYAALLGYAVNSFVLPAFVSELMPRDGLLAVSACLISLVLLNPPSIRMPGARLASLIDFLGRMSYPLFLIHWVASVWLYALIGQSDPWLFLGGFPSSLALAALLVVAVDRPVELIRRRIRQERRGGLSRIAGADAGAARVHPMAPRPESPGA